MFEIGQLWQGFQVELDTAVDEAQKAAESVWKVNHDKGIDEFTAAWKQHGDAMETPAKTQRVVSFCRHCHSDLRGGRSGSQGSCDSTVDHPRRDDRGSGGRSAGTFGASLLIIPLVKYAIGLIIDQLIDLALGVLVG